MNTLHSEELFVIEVVGPNQPTRSLPVIDSLTAGLDPRNDLILVDSLMGAKHFHFKRKDHLLSLHFLGDDHTTFLNNLPLEKDKSYLLEKGDRLRCGHIQIRIRYEKVDVRPVSSPKARPTENKETHVHLAPIMPPPSQEQTPPVHQEKKKPAPQYRPSFPLKKMPFKIFGFFIDLSFVYFLLAFVIPTSGFLAEWQRILYPVTEFFTKTYLLQHPEFSQWKVLSVGEFFIVFHLVMLASALILGNTPGAWLIGFHPVQKNIFTHRFQAYLYSLINIALLPFLIFDFPIFNGKSLKELLSFFNREINSNRAFVLIRSTLAPSLVVLFILAPLFLKSPYSAVVVEAPLSASRFKDVHTHTISSISNTFGTEVKTELHNNFSILPAFSAKKIGLTLFDHSTGKSLTLQERWRMPNDYALFAFRYSNPFSSLWLPNDQINSEQLKSKSLMALATAPVDFFQEIKHFGLFFGNAVLFRQQFLRDFAKSDSFLVTPFQEKNPFILISSGTEENLFWFTRTEIIAFELKGSKQPKILEHFSRDIIAGMRFSQAYTDKLKKPEILEALDAFERGNYQTLLTYYIYEAKKSLDSVNMKDQHWRAFLRSNIAQTKQALNGNMNKNIEKSFDDILNQLQ